jgi:GWxTD domain-containing protein
MSNKNRGGLFRLGLGAAGLAVVLWGGAACHLYNLERNLKPADAEFLSQVRYIITGEERRTFLESPESDHPKLIKDFWNRRDPDPDTPENEFKDEYLGRIEKANELFHGEGKPGWLTDRGRIYILLGPPLDRIINPPSLSTGRQQCAEVWYYGQFPVVFSDANCTGYYQLVTYDLTPVRELNLAYMSELGKAQGRAQMPLQPQEKSLFDFDWSVRTTSVTEDRVEGLVVVEVPVASIWFKAVKDKLETVLDIELELNDSQGDLYWEQKTRLPLSTTEEELKTQLRAKIRKEIPFVFDKDLDRLRAGKNKFVIQIKNATGDESLRKMKSFTL